MLQQLQDITYAILSSTNNDEEKAKVAQLANLLRQLTEADNTYPDQDYIVKGGIALSPKHAADCVLDAHRTARFIKGTYEAIQELMNRFGTEKLNILYAGTGPYATILLPLLSILPKGSVAVTLIDISPCSIDSVKHIFKILGLENFITDAIVCDATTYSFPKAKPLHLAITETMFTALVREPQVSISSNIAGQLTTGGLLIPEQINLTLWTVFWGNESLLDPKKVRSIETGDDAEISQKRFIGPLMSVDQSFRLSVATDFIESAAYLVPEQDALSPDLCIFTEIKVYNQHKIGYQESVLTDPFFVIKTSDLISCKEFRLIYKYSTTPEWVVEMC